MRTLSQHRMRLKAVRLNARLAMIAIALLGASACGRARDQTPQSPPRALPVVVIADTAPSAHLRIEAPRPPLVWLARVSIDGARAPEPALPEASPDTLLPELRPPALVVDQGLKPPILREPARLTPAEATMLAGLSRGGSIEVDVRVDEFGRVSDALWAGGSADSTRVRLAVECARRMTFYPALKGGQPIAVWCRQRFDLDSRP